MLAWIICISTFLGGLAAQMDLPRMVGDTISTGLFVASFFSCPALWRLYPLSDFLSGKQRAAAIARIAAAEPKRFAYIPFLSRETADYALAGLSLIHISEPTRPY